MTIPSAFITHSPVPSHSIRISTIRTCSLYPSLPFHPSSTAFPSQTLRMSAAVRGSVENPYRICVLPGDGSGPLVADATKRVLRELTAYADIHFDFIDTPYGAPSYDSNGVLVTDDTIHACRTADAVLRSYQGQARGIGRQGSAHLQLRDKLGLFAQFRPLVIYPQLAAASTLRKEVVANTDIMLVREVSAGALGSNIIASESDESISEISYSSEQVDAIAGAALSVAERRSGRIMNVDKADVMSVSRFWRKTLHESIAKKAAGNDGIILSDMFVDDFVREVILRPGQFDVVVTSNLFGDILAEVIAALAGPQRQAPSYWMNKEGLAVYGPADIYNAAAYPDTEQSDRSPIAMIRSASMMLRYTLDEPAAANIIQQALRQTLDDVATPGAPPAANRNGNGKGFLPTVSTMEYADVVVRSMQVMRQNELVCDPSDCGE